MSFNLEDLRGPVTSILTTPGVDLSTISAKRVRKELLADTTLGITARELKERRTEVDFLISKIYESISRQEQGDESKRKREGEVDEDLEHEDQEDVAEERDTGEEPAEDDEKPPPPKKNKSAKQNVDADAELARKISSELNSRSRRGASNGASATPKKRKTKKSAKMVDSGDEDDDEEKPKKKRSGGARGGFAKEYMLRCFKLPLSLFYVFLYCAISSCFPLLQRIPVSGCWRGQALATPSREETMGIYSRSCTSEPIQQA